MFKPTLNNTVRFSTKAPRASAMKNSASAVTLAPHRGARRVGTLLIMSTMGLAYFQLENSRALCAAGGAKGGSDMPSPTDLLAKV